MSDSEMFCNADINFKMENIVKKCIIPLIPIAYGCFYMILLQQLWTV